MPSDYQPPPHWKRTVALVWSGQAVSFLTSGAAGYAIVWHLTEATGSAVVLAAASIAIYLPYGIFGPFAGIIVDRLDRKVLMIVADMGIAVVCALTALLIALGMMSVPLAVAILALRSVGQAVHSPAMRASMPLLVPDRHLVRLASLNQGLAGAAHIVAPALGILLYTALGLQFVLLADTFGAIVACSLLAVVRIPAAQMTKAERSGLLNEMREGLASIREQRGLGMFIVFVALTCTALAPMASFLPLMTYEHFSLGGWEASLVEAAFGIGYLAGSVVLGVWGGGRRLFALIAAAALAAGLIASGCGLLPSSGFLTFVVLAALMAFAESFYGGPIGALFQRRIVPSKLGRVLAINDSAFCLATPLGLLFAGPLAEAVGTGALFVISGSLLAAIALLGLLAPTLRGLDRQSSPQ
ncbi:MAG: MFS transporter [Coriobacteriales bacterium]|jgi:DHA3 family macrolide efflux protein-like MFS transporter|nr:MFS transporter [Coriobacteriales bacterium]